RDLHRNPFERTSVGRVNARGLSTGQIAPKDRVLTRRVRLAGGRKNEIDVRRGMHRQSIEVLGPAAIDEVVHLDEILAVCCCREVEEGLGPAAQFLMRDASSSEMQLKRAIQP